MASDRKERSALAKRYDKKLHTIREGLSDCDKVVVLDNMDARSILSAIIFLLNENAELREQIETLETRVDGLDPAPKYRTSDKEPRFKTSDGPDDKGSGYLSFFK